MIESPRKRFCKNTHSKVLHELLLDPAIIAGLDASILQMQWEYGAAKTSEAAAAIHWQLTGAARLRELFLTITTVEKNQPASYNDNLPNEI